MHKKEVGWVTYGEDAHSHLSDLLAYATTNYANHSNWFLRHKDAGFRTLATVLTAEFAIAGFSFSNKLPDQVSIPALLILGILSLPLTWLARLSCSRAYRAAMEHIVLIAKIVSAMGLGGKIPVSAKLQDSGTFPVPGDISLFVPRYLADTREVDNTEDFVRRHLAVTTNSTFSTTIWTLTLAGAVAFLGGIGAAIAMWFAA